MKKLVLYTVLVFLLSSCASTKQTRSSLYPKMYEEKPLTILVMPPINNTNKEEAKEYFYSSIAKPLNEKGYYVVSPFLAMDLLRQESAYDSEMFVNGSLKPFQDVFGADAVLFTTINKWEKQSALSYINVDILYTLKSAKTGETLFEREGELQVSFSSGNNSLLGMALSMLTTATTDHVVAARACNNYILTDLPDGYYSPNHLKDQNFAASGKKAKGKVSK